MIRRARPPVEEKNVNIDADVTIEEGAFQGVSDEELPKKVRDEVDQSFDEIVEDLESKGGEVV